jgi:hypothetical protein
MDKNPERIRELKDEIETRQEDAVAPHGDNSDR